MNNNIFSVCATQNFNVEGDTLNILINFIISFIKIGIQFTQLLDKILLNLTNFLRVPSLTL